MSDTPKLNPLLVSFAMLGAAYREAHPAEPAVKCERCGQAMVADANREILMCPNPLCGEGA